MCEVWKVQLDVPGRGIITIYVPTEYPGDLKEIVAMALDHSRKITMVRTNMEQECRG